MSGGWSTNGDTIVIKDMKLFAEEVIPTAYKHNNFSSFVRQLNFCKYFVSSVILEIYFYDPSLSSTLFRRLS